MCAVSLAPVGCGDDDTARGSLPTAEAGADDVTGSSGSVADPGSTGSSTTLPDERSTSGRVEQLRVEVIERLPHDATAFTQGLELDGDVLYESAGLYGESSVRVADPHDGTVRERLDIDHRFFAEGLTRVDDALVVLTWKEGVAFVLDADTLEERGRHTYDGEGWGICDDGDRLVMSDGTSALTFRDRATFASIDRVDVTLDGQPITQLNELECVDGEVYANVWQTDMIVRIDPTTGQVTATIDAAGLLTEAERRDADVLNGIAHDDGTDTFLVTGKHWPALFRVRFVPAD